MQFLYQPLTWGFLLVGVPILVHLINMLRHRRVKWAAMDFLLESHRKNRRWVMLKQWLLLASRILAMLLLVAMLAKWISGAQWLNFVGGQTTHHYLLLDDSYSMSEMVDNETAYARSLNATSKLLQQISRRPGQHQITLLRWSRALLALRDSGEDARIDSAADLLGQSVTQDPAKLLERINVTEPTALSLEPKNALELVVPLVAENSEQRSEVYLISDLRRNEFGAADELKNQLRSLDQNSAKIHVVDCGGTEDGNASLISVEPEQDVWAAGVPLMVRFQVRNRTQRPLRNAIVKVRVVTYAEGIAKPKIDELYSGIVRDEPSIVIEEIQPGETVTRQFQTIFGLPGNHVIELSISDDSLMVDNRRWCSIKIKQSQQVLLVDGDLEQRNAFFFESVVNPNPKLSTGIDVKKQDTAFLRDIAPELLRKFDVIALLDVPRMDAQAVTKLEEYVKQGGGLLFVCGSNTNQQFVNEQLYRSGEGFFPGPVSSIVDVAQNLDSAEAQVSAVDHPILAPLLQLESSPFFQLRIRKLAELELAKDAAVDFVARGPNGRPLVIDSVVGEGHVVSVLTGLDSEWSNWPQDPTFVILGLRSLGYLGSFRREPTSVPTGDDVNMTVVDESILPDGEILVPGREDGLRLRLQQRVDQSTSDVVASMNLEVGLDGPERDLIDSLLRPGVFESWMTTAQGKFVVQNSAHNVPAAEGDLERVSQSEFEQSMRGIPLEFKSADSLINTGLNMMDSEHSTVLLCLLGFLLVGEQALAYSASYHAPAGGKS